MSKELIPPPHVTGSQMKGVQQWQGLVARGNWGSLYVLNLIICWSKTYRNSLVTTQGPLSIQKLVLGTICVEVRFNVNLDCLCQFLKNKVFQYVRWLFDIEVESIYIYKFVVSILMLWHREAHINWRRTHCAPCRACLFNFMRNTNYQNMNFCIKYG